MYCGLSLLILELSYAFSFYSKITHKNCCLFQTHLMQTPPSLPTSLNSWYRCLQVNAAYISEYSRDSEVSRGRSRFFHGQKDILLYSGRAHFFRYT
jgi:hypothetical protein